jgi:hypothetical protein
MMHTAHCAHFRYIGILIMRAPKTFHMRIFVCGCFFFVWYRSTQVRTHCMTVHTSMQMRDNTRVLELLIHQGKCIEFLADVLHRNSARDVQQPTTHLLAILCTRIEAQEAAVRCHLRLSSGN